MTKPKAHPLAAAHKPVKKADPITGFKSSIMIASIVGTMAGWLLLLQQETEPLSVNTVNTAIAESNEMAAEPPTGVNINQLRQVNAVQAAPVAAIAVVARTRSSR